MFTNIPIKHAGSNSEAFWLRPTCSRNQAGLYMPDPTSRIQFGSVFFQRKPGSNCAKPTRIRSGWPLQVWGKHIVFTSKPVYNNHQAWFWQNATGPLPVSHFQTRLRFSTDGPDYVVQNQAGSDLVLADCVRFGPNRSGPEVSQYASMLESSGHLANATKPIWI